ncbi:MAG: hypothetical protein AAGG50_06650, partial [Bacteroidota bacterium]
PYDDLRGIRVTRQARARWVEEFEERRDPMNRPYYWLGGRFVNLDERGDTDQTAVEEGYVSVTPLQHDLTAHAHLDRFRAWSWNGLAADTERVGAEDEAEV